MQQQVLIFLNGHQSQPLFSKIWVQTSTCHIFSVSTIEAQIFWLAEKCERSIILLIYLQLVILQHVLKHLFIFLKLLNQSILILPILEMWSLKVFHLFMTEEQTFKANTALEKLAKSSSCSKYFFLLSNEPVEVFFLLV